MERIGVFGGSFNPVHVGHLLVAQAAQEELELDTILFVPASISPFKSSDDLAPAEARVEWLRLALGCRPAWEIDQQELERGGVSYTIDTLLDIRRRQPGASLSVLIGADLAPQLPSWKRSTELANLAEFIIVPRPGQMAARAPDPFRSRLLKGIPLGVSSSLIRQRVRQRLPIDLLLPPGVADAILKSKLYQ